MLMIKWGGGGRETGQKYRPAIIYVVFSLSLMAITKTYIKAKVVQVKLEAYVL